MIYEVFKIVRPDKNNSNIFYSSVNNSPSGYIYEQGVRKTSTTPIFVFRELQYAIEFAGDAAIARGYSTGVPFAMTYPFVLNTNYYTTFDVVEAFWSYMHDEDYVRARSFATSNFYPPESYGVYDFTLEEIVRPGRGIYEA
jgi:hypothetical protein